MDYKNKIASLIKIEGILEEEIYKNIGKVQDDNMGDYCLPCFKYSKVLRKSPVVISDEFCTTLNALKTGSPADLVWLEKVEAVNGYLNFFLNKREFASTVLSEVYSKGVFFAKKHPNGKRVCIEFSSINIAKPFHIGHLLTTVIGGALYRIYAYLGYDVVGINHLGDWGTQFGKMIVAFLEWGEKGDKSKLTVDSLSKLYVKFHEEAEKCESLNDMARAWFKKLEDGDEEAFKLFQIFKEITLKEVKKVYKMLGVHFDSYKGESFFNKKSLAVVDELKRKKLLVKSDGAEVVTLDEDNMPPCIILKSDGATLYATRDIATAIYRKRYYNFDKCLYIVAYQQELHFKQFFKVLEKMGYEWVNDCVHVPFGMVSLEGEGSLSTRKGNVVLLRDVLETSVKKVHDIIEKKNPKLACKKRTSLAIGAGAVIFGALSNSRIKDMVFSYEKALNFEGETGPYIQYTHARCCSVIAKARKILRVKEYKDINFSLLDDVQSFAVIKYLNEYDSVVADAAEKYEPSIVSRYLIDLSQSYNKFYMENRIITDDYESSVARLYLTECVRNTLRNGLGLILIKAPEKM